MTTEERYDDEPGFPYAAFCPTEVYDPENHDKSTCPFCAEPPQSDRKSNVSPSEIKDRLASWSHVANQIINGLNGKPFNWSGGEFDSYGPKAKAMGITLVTKTRIMKMGYRLKRGVQPVGTGYFYSPISKSCNLYILECQAVKFEAENEQAS